MTDTHGYFRTRLAPDPRRRRVWQALYRHFFSTLIRPGDCVLDLGCGYGDFINAVRARRRIAIDQWAGFVEHIDPGVECHVGSVTDLSFLADGSVNLAFASNVLEHLSHDAAAAMLGQLRVKLASGGCLVLVQPNYRYAYREYFDDYTHVTAYSHHSLCDFLAVHGFAVTRAEPRFLPLTIRSRLPVSSWLIGAYLRLPVKPGAKQMLIVSTPVARA